MKIQSIPGRAWIILAIKVVIILTAFLAAFLLRFDFAIPQTQLDFVQKAILPLLAIKLVVFWRTGLNQGWWRYASLADVIEIFKANVIASLGFLFYVFFVYHMTGIPRSVLILDFVFCFLLSCGIRFATRAFRENYFPMLRDTPSAQNPVLFVGAGQAGQMLVREFRQNGAISKTIIGFIDDDPDKQRRRFQGVPVLGTQENLQALCLQHRIKEVIIAIPSATGMQLRQIVNRCQGAGVHFKTLPGVADLIEGRVTVQQVRDVDVQDLLGREQVRIDSARVGAFLQGKRVLVTGAAGSIGSEICRQVARFTPAKIILIDHAESPLFFIENELSEKYPELRIATIVGDIRDKARIGSVFDEYLPEVVFHAAAYKHVPMMEHNPAEAANNNVHGTKIIADAAHAFGVKNFVLISTDKAVNPTNIMGATKRAAEIYVQDLSLRSKTHFVTVRFGNVLASTGSVIPIFKAQILAGGPVKVTHREVTRFFMTISEATQLVLQAGSMGSGGEIFLLDMGEPVKIIHLAEQLIRLSGMKPYEDIDIVFTGLRPGEKLFEELLLAGEGVMPTSHEKICVAKASVCNSEELREGIEELYQAQRALDIEAVQSILKKIVPEYRSSAEESPKSDKRIIKKNVA